MSDSSTELHEDVFPPWLYVLLRYPNVYWMFLSMCRWVSDHHRQKFSVSVCPECVWDSFLIHRPDYRCGGLCLFIMCNSIKQRTLMSSECQFLVEFLMLLASKEQTVTRLIHFQVSWGAFTTWTNPIVKQNPWLYDRIPLPLNVNPPYTSPQAIFVYWLCRFLYAWSHSCK